jgi:sugar/nucleoside kinase (ribokinase family)
MDFVTLIAMFIIVIAVVSMFGKSKNSEAMKNLNTRIKANTAEVILDFNERAEDRGMNKEKFQHAIELLDSI